MISSHFQIFKLAHFQIMRNDKENVIVTKAVNFSLAIIRYTEVLGKKICDCKTAFTFWDLDGCKHFRGAECRKPGRLHTQNENSRQRSQRNALLVAPM